MLSHNSCVWWMNSPWSWSMSQRCTMSFCMTSLLLMFHVNNEIPNKMLLSDSCHSVNRSHSGVFFFPKYNYFSFVCVKPKEAVWHPVVNLVNTLIKTLKGGIVIRWQSKIHLNVISIQLCSYDERLSCLWWYVQVETYKGWKVLVKALTPGGRHRSRT